MIVPPVDMAGPAGTMVIRCQLTTVPAVPTGDMAKARPNDTKPPDLADQLRRAIGGCGMSLNQLAKATGVNKAQLSRFMRGERHLSLPAADNVCRALGWTLNPPPRKGKK